MAAWVEGLLSSNVSPSQKTTQSAKKYDTAYQEQGVDISNRIMSVYFWGLEAALPGIWHVDQTISRRNFQFAGKYFTAKALKLKLQEMIK